jgi:Thymosin beta-4 family
MFFQFAFVLCFKLLHTLLFIDSPAVDTEKAEQARKDEIEKFSKDQLRQTETVEKVVLPDAHGTLPVSPLSEMHFVPMVPVASPRNFDAVSVAACKRCFFQVGGCSAVMNCYRFVSSSAA